MKTLLMVGGDIAISDVGQPVMVGKTDKLKQDMAESLNSEYDSKRNYGGDLVNLSVTPNEQAVITETYQILERLRSKQSEADEEEKIKSIDYVTAVQKDATAYVYMEVSSGKTTVAETIPIL